MSSDAPEHIESSKLWFAHHNKKGWLKAFFGVQIHDGESYIIQDLDEPRQNAAASCTNEHPIVRMIVDELVENSWGLTSVEVQPSNMIVSFDPRHIEAGRIAGLIKGVVETLGERD